MRQGNELLQTINKGVVVYFRPGVILGVTNPFFAKTLQHWPHMVRIGEMSNLGKQAGSPLALYSLTVLKLNIIRY